MPVYISLLRGINVGGNKKVPMAALKTLYQSLGFSGTQTLLQSGNAIFETAQTDVPVLAQQIEAGIQRTFGFESRIILRTPDELRQVFQHSPFPELPAPQPDKLMVMFLSEAPESARIERLLQAHSGPEKIHVQGREVYLYYSEGAGRSKLSNVLIEKHLGVSGTTRNWNTVTKLVDLADSFPE